MTAYFSRCHLTSLFAVAMILMAFSGCTYYQPVPVSSGPSKFDRCWDAANGAAADVGVQITSSDRASGVITGYADSVDVTVLVRTQADGGVRVEFNTKGPRGQDTALADSLSRAYDRRMGR